MATISSSCSISSTTLPVSRSLVESVPSTPPLFYRLTPSCFNPWKRFVAFWSKNTITIETLLERIREGAHASEFSAFIEALKSPHFHAMRAQLKDFFRELSFTKKDACLKAVAAFSLENNEKELISRSLDLLTIEQIQDLAREIYRCSSPISELAEIECKLAEIDAKHTSDYSSKVAVQSELRKAINYLKNLTFTVLNSLLASTQFFEIGREPETAWDASFQLEIYYKVLSIPLTIATFIYGYLKNPVATTLASILALCGLLSGLYTYLKWIQPAPVRLPHGGINLTQEEKKSPKGPTIARAKELNAIIDQLAGNASPEARQHCLVSGRTGVGKTELIKGLVHRIVQGNVPEVLKGKEVFSFNASELCEVSNSFTGQWKLGDVIKKLGRHANQAIIILEEAHGLVHSQKEATKVLTVLDTSLESLPFVIALVSEDKIDQIKEHPALYRRFKEIKVEQTSDEQTLEILTEALKQRLPDIEVEEGLLEEIIKRTNPLKESSQPSKAKNVLLQLCGHMQSEMEGGALREKLTKLEDDLYKAEIASKRLPKDCSDASQEEKKQALSTIKVIECEIQKTKVESTTFSEAFATFKKMKEQSRRIHKEMIFRAKCLLAKKDVDANTKLFLFTKLYLTSASDQATAAFKETHKLNVTLKKDALDKIAVRPK